MVSVKLTEEVEYTNELIDFDERKLVTGHELPGHFDDVGRGRKHRRPPCVSRAQTSEMISKQTV